MSYEPKKAAQLIAYLIMKSGGDRLNILKAVKLVYLVDRYSLEKFGFPVLEERRVSMPHGPVNSLTYDYLNGVYDPDPVGWSEVLRDRENHNIALANSDLSIEGLDELSDADIECADAVWASFGHMTQWELRDWTHDPSHIPEWEEPNGGSTVIPLQRILNAVGVSNAEEFANEAESFRHIEDAFRRARLN
ncbi:MAG: Panacea domain-containing protein [Roseibium sp.]|uniref:Panacea domain-containing protein n=1 Tax=Roseibium sp. TaxID=1936156 RepID=UPI003296E271